MVDDVFLITIDALRDDYFHRDYFSECWDVLSTDFAHFENAYSNGVATPLSFPSIHTGYPAESKGELRSTDQTLAELYRGYSFAISNNPHLRPDRGYARGFDHFTRELEGPSEDHEMAKSLYSRAKAFAGRSEILRTVHNSFWKAVGATDVGQPDLSRTYSRTAEAILSALSDAIQSESGFFWVHLMDPHHPYYPQKITDNDIDLEVDNKRIKEINRRIRAPAKRSMGLAENGEDEYPTEEEIKLCKQLYGEIVKYIDRQVAEFLTHLKTEDRWEESMVILMADHGEAFGEDDVYQHDWTANPTDSLVRVPLAVKYPDNNVTDTFTHPVQTGDLLATLSEVLGWNTNAPPHTRPFTDSGYRPIISKSNNAIRVTTNDGYAIRRGDSIVEQSGIVDEEAMSVLQSSSYPAVETLSGDVLGMNKKEHQELEQRLEHLGYR